MIDLHCNPSVPDAFEVGGVRFEARPLAWLSAIDWSQAPPRLETTLVAEDAHEMTWAAAALLERLRRQREAS